jgi:hypothetical protein
MDDYCDSCGPAVRAKVYVALPSGNVLSYCGHHADTHRGALEALGAFLYPLDDA